MSKKISFKIGMCFAFALLLFTSFKNTNAYADTKDVTITVTSSFDAPESELANIFQSISNTPYQYDDGTYKGTLNCTSISLKSQTIFEQFPNFTVYLYTIDITYSGTVASRIVGLTKDVTVTHTETFDAPESELATILQSISSSGYAYDDGTYKGRLNCTSINVVTQTIFEQYPNYTIYLYTVNVTYTGTVTSY